MTTIERPDTLADAIGRLARTRPDGLAVVEGATRWTWSELDQRASAIAGSISAAIGASGGRIGLALGPTALGVSALHAIARTRASAVLVHPRLSASEVASLLDMADCRVLAIGPGVDIEPPADVSLTRLETSSADARATVPDAADPAVAPVRDDRDAELIVATSGTTARPRLARLPLDRVVASASAWNEFLPPATGWLLSLGLAHVAGIGIVARAALAGVPVVVPRGEGADGLLRTMAAGREQGVVVSHVSLVATQLERLLDASDGTPAPDGLRAVILGGGPTSESLLQRAIDRGWPVIPSYGLTESASGVVALASSEVGAHATTVGRPLSGVELRIGDDGRVAIRGPMVFPGYLEDPAGSPAAPAGPSPDGWLTTNDLGRLDADGRLTVLGRIDDVIISGGEKIAPPEVEAALLDHPDIADAAVIAAPDPTWGSVPVAIIVVRRGRSTADDELRAHAATRLASFKVPARFIRVEALPRNDLGKISRADLARLARDSDRRHAVTLADGQVISVRDIASADAGPDAPVVVLLHATLSTASQLAGLARRLADRARVLIIDRRGSGGSPMTTPAPVEVERHAADVVEVLDQLGIDRATLFGHSFGGVVALRAAVQAPDRVDRLVVWEPPFLVLAEPAVQARMRAMTDAAQLAFERHGAAAAARLFLDGVGGAGAWERLAPRQRDAIDREGAGVLADVAMGGLTADGLDAIDTATVIVTGGASVPFYRPIADALAERIGPNARRVDLPDLGHPAPITSPDAIATLVLGVLEEPHA